MNTDDSFQHYRKLNAPRANLPESELTQIKAHWLKLPEAEQNEWISFLLSNASVAETREWILKKSKINLNKRDQIKRFRQWLIKQDEATKKARELQKREERIRNEHPDWSLNQVRDEVLTEAYFATLAERDFKTGLQAVSAHCRTETVQLNQRRYEDSKRSNEEKAVQFSLDATKDYPEVQELFKQAFAALKKATTGK